MPCPENRAVDKWTSQSEGPLDTGSVDREEPLTGSQEEPLTGSQDWKKKQ